eukprot:4455769-Prymnesium_polylepis.1
MLANALLVAAASSPLDADARFNWTNEHGGPLVDRGDPISRLATARAPTAAPTSLLRTLRSASAPPFNAPPFNYTKLTGFLAAGNDLSVVEVDSAQEALDACSALAECRGVTYSAGPNGTVTRRTKAYLKRSAAHSGGAPWISWVKAAPIYPPAKTFHFDGLALALRAGSFTVQWLNVSCASYPLSNLSFVPALTPGSALPLIQHLGDMTMR